MAKPPSPPNGKKSSFSVRLPKYVRDRFLEAVFEMGGAQLEEFARLAIREFHRALSEGEISYHASSQTFHRYITLMEDAIHKLPKDRQPEAREALKDIKEVGRLNPRLRVIDRGYPAQDSPTLEVFLFFNEIVHRDKDGEETDLEIVYALPGVPTDP